MAATAQFLRDPCKFRKEWQPNLYEWKKYHSSHPDVKNLGWQKWAGSHPDWYTKKSSSECPAWYSRSNSTIRNTDYQNITWVYDRPSKSTSRVQCDYGAFPGVFQEKSFTNQRFETGRPEFKKPSPVPMEIPPPKWGLYNPLNYEEPVRLQHFPPIKYKGY